MLKHLFMNSIPFSKEEYKELVRMIMITTEVIERVDFSDENREKLYQFEEKISSYAKRFGIKDLPNDVGSKIFDEVEILMSNYDEEVFEFELVNRLEQRDLNEMSSDEREKLEEEFDREDFSNTPAKKYWNDFDKNGVKNLRLQKDNNSK